MQLFTTGKGLHDIKSNDIDSPQVKSKVISNEKDIVYKLSNDLQRILGN